MVFLSDTVTPSFCREYFPRKLYSNFWATCSYEDEGPSKSSILSSQWFVGPSMVPQFSGPYWLLQLTVWNSKLNPRNSYLTKKWDHIFSSRRNINLCLTLPTSSHFSTQDRFNVMISYTVFRFISVQAAHISLRGSTGLRRRCLRRRLPRV